MDVTESLLVALLVGLFLLAVFVAAGETALIRTPSIRVEHLVAEGRRGATRLQRLVERLPTVLNAILLTALLAQIGAATVTGLLAERWFGSFGVTIASVVLTVVLFVYAEAIPKTYAVRHSDQVALAMSGPIAGLELVLRPIVAVLVWFADLQMPGKGITTNPTITEGELKLLAEKAASEGQITEEDRQLIQRAFRIGDLTCDDVMVPRHEMRAVASDASVAEAIDLAVEAGHRRLPVRGSSSDDIVGVVGLRDLVGIPPERRSIEVGAIAASPLVVPESKQLLDLLRTMQAESTHLAIVVDEYGGTAGLVTIEDIVEELLGSITESTGEDVVPLDGGGWSIDGRMPVEDLEDLLGESLPEGSWSSVAGLTLGLAGRLVEVGDELAIDDHLIRVLTIRGRRVARVAVIPRR